MNATLRPASVIREEIFNLQRERDAITSQLAAAAVNAGLAGRPVDRQWKRRAEDAFRVMGRKIAHLQVELGPATKAERATEHAIQEAAPTKFERAFIRKAKELLPRDLYDLVLREALEISNAPTESLPEEPARPGIVGRLLQAVRS